MLFRSTLIVATFFFAFQIYADFSGYTDIALGSASLFGFKLSDNFRKPYFSKSIQEFWSRWHITFSNWLRDYVFLPLAFWFSKKMKREHYFLIRTEKWIYLFSIMITFAICGVWHGEGANYLVWGLLFGLFLTISNWTEKSNKTFRKRFNIKKSSLLYNTFQILLTFSLVCLSWIFFRAKDLSTAINIITQMGTSTGRVF